MPGGSFFATENQKWCLPQFEKENGRNTRSSKLCYKPGECCEGNEWSQRWACDAGHLRATLDYHTIQSSPPHCYNSLSTWSDYPVERRRAPMSASIRPLQPGIWLPTRLEESAAFLNEKRYPGCCRERLRAACGIAILIISETSCGQRPLFK